MYGACSVGKSEQDAYRDSLSPIVNLTGAQNTVPKQDASLWMFLKLTDLSLVGIWRGGIQKRIVETAIDLR